MIRVVLLLALLLSACTQSQRRTFACEHCTCGDRDLAHPVTCELLGTEQFVYCCVADSS